MHEVTIFATAILVVAAGFSAALMTTKVTARFPVPAPVLFLLAASIAAALFPGLPGRVTVRIVERVAVVALIVILFDGGLSIRWRRLRASLVPIASLGVLGTFATAGVVALFAHWALGFGWMTAGLLGAAVAPTDPAVMFSVLGGREIAGRTGTILEGESGANDPVGIALMIGLIELATHRDATFWVVVREFSVQMAVGLAIGIVGGRAIGFALRRVSLPDEGLYTIRALAGAGVVYGTASVLHGSGFLAVFVAGLIVGDVSAPFKQQVELFHNALASLAEIVVFVALGLTVAISSPSAARWADGIAIAAFVALVARPLVVGPLLLPARLRANERLFVMWGGLKGAVPILLAAFALLGGVGDARRIYEIVFVVVLVSVLVQGSSIPLAARLLRIPMRQIEPAGAGGAGANPAA